MNTENIRREGSFSLDYHWGFWFATFEGFGGKTMRINDWWVENFTGKVDSNPLYDGLRSKERRNPRKCTAYVARREAEATTDAAEHLRSSAFHTPDTSVMKRRIYSSSYILRGKYDAVAERSVIESAFSEVLESAGNAVPDWSVAVAGLKDEPGMLFYFPGLFNQDVAIIWEDYVNAVTVKREREASEARAEAARKATAAQRKAEEEAERRKAAQAQRAAIQGRIETLTAEIARLNAMYYNETEFLEKARLMYAVEAREDAVRQLQDRL